MSVIVHTVRVAPKPSTSHGPEELSIAQLSERSGVPITALRMYQQRKLLAPPERRGRNGVYSTAHLERLAVIDRLQKRGYSLAAILDVLSQPEGGLDKLIDSEVPTLADNSVTMSLVELVGRLPAADFSLDTLERTQRLRLIELKGSDVIVHQPAFLTAGSALTAMGVPSASILDAYESLRDHVAAIASEFAGIYDEHVAELASGPDLDAAAAQLDQLTRIAVEVVSSELRSALREITKQRLAKMTSPTPQ
jgi:DNA-binding transcriptional MerR regulator